MKHAKIGLLQSGLLLAILASPAIAAEILPMHYSEGFGGPVESAGSRVLPGAKVEIRDGNAVATPAPVIYVAPQKSTVTAGEMQVNQAANCSVIKNELDVEAKASKLATDALDLAQDDFKLIQELSADKDKAVKDCLNAKKNRLPDATDICAYKDELLSSIKELNASASPYTDQAQNIVDAASKRINEFGSQVGGYAGADIQLFNQSEIAAVRNANPGREVRVVPMNNITFSFNPGEEALTGMEIGRRTTIGYFLKGESMSSATPTGTPAAVTKITSGAATSLGIILSRLGACEPKLLRTGTFDYWYDGYGLLAGEVSYNKWVFYSKLEENKTSGGFFTTKSVKKVKEDLKNTEAFTVAVIGKQQGNSDTANYDVLQMEERLNDRLEKRLLRMMADKVDGTPAADPLAAPSQNGSDATGDALLKCPDTYCQIGGYALKALSAIFGGQVSRAEAQRQWDYNIKETWSQTTVTPYINSTNAVVKWTN